VERWEVSSDKQRYQVPQTWTWMCFAGVGEQRLGKMLDVAKNKGELKPYLRNTNVQWMRFELGDVKEMRIEEAEQTELRLKKGDLLICEGGEPGRCAIWNDQLPEMYFQKALHRVRPCGAILSEFLALHLQIDYQNDTLATYFTGATIKHLTGRSLDQYPVSIPPLAEQMRIVAKVDQLMALVDQLETQLTASSTTAEKLMEAIVAEFTSTSKQGADET
jgi:type I restriction enzyme S subunit